MTSDQQITEEQAKQEVLPDLAGLERVQTNDLRFLVLIGGYLALMVGLIVPGIVMVFLLGIWRYVPREGIALVCATVVLLLWVLIRMLLGDCWFRSDPCGLTIRSALRRRFLRWDEVLSARIVVALTGETFVMLDTSHGRVTIYPRGFGTAATGDAIVASIWQHLRRLGKADGMVLTPNMLRLWEPVPGDVPSSVDWEKIPSTIAKLGSITAILVIVAFVLSGIWWICTFRFSWAFLPFVLTLILMWGGVIKWIVIPELLHKAWSVRVRPDGIEAKTLFSSVYISWSDVVLAMWRPYGLYIRGNAGGEVIIPFMSGNRESEILAMAIVRHLRTCGSPQALSLRPLMPGRMGRRAIAGTWSG
jgi:hypothetical protein